MPDWPGPLFYPTAGSIAVMRSGSRIEVWPHEGRSSETFTGINLADGDASCLWLRDCIDHLEARDA